MYHTKAPTLPQLYTQETGSESAKDLNFRMQVLSKQNTPLYAQETHSADTNSTP